MGVFWRPLCHSQLTQGTLSHNQTPDNPSLSWQTTKARRLLLSLLHNFFFCSCNTSAESEKSPDKRSKDVVLS